MTPSLETHKEASERGALNRVGTENMNTGNPVNIEAGILPASSAEDLLSIAMQYCLGKGVAQNLVAAHKWFNIAAMKGSAAARQYRCELAREMSAADVAEAQRAARAWLTLH
jgi:uncharacterized protein